MKITHLPILALLAPCALASDWTVTPGDSVQAAIDAAASGDTILIVPDTYPENLVIDGKQLVLRSHPASGSAVVDGAGLGPALEIRNGAQVELEGLTFLNGYAPRGGGVYAHGAALTMRNCVVLDNRANEEGAGVWCDADGLVLQNCELRQNSMSWPLAAPASYGGGLFASGDDVLIQGCLFEYNDCWASSTGHGGALYSKGDDLQLAGCTFRYNNAEYWHVLSEGDRTIIGDCSVYGGSYGGVRCTGSAIVTDCLIDGCSSPYGEAGLEIVGGDFAVIRRCVVRGTDTWRAVLLATVNAYVDECSITDNPYGAGIETAGSYAILERCTLAGNGVNAWVPQGGLTAGGVVSLRDSIVYGNGNVHASGSPPADEIQGDTSALAVTYCNVRGGWPGTGNQQDDPGYLDAAAGDYRLGAGSACIDTASPSSFPVGVDLYGMPRVLDGNADGLLRLDMGAHEYGNVRLGISGDPVPGGDLSIELEADLPVIGPLLVGTAPGELMIAPYGALLFDLTAPWSPATSWMSLPISFEVQVPLTLATPRTLIFQALGFDLSSGTGNLSNAVELIIE